MLVILQNPTEADKLAKIQKDLDETKVILVQCSPLVISSVHSCIRVVLQIELRGRGNFVSCASVFYFDLLLLITGGGC